MINLVSFIVDFLFLFRSLTNLLQPVETCSLLCMPFKYLLAFFGQTAEQRARGPSFHALPPQPQMFTSKTSPLIQVGA